mgnify:CR=1 FL=1
MGRGGQGAVFLTRTPHVAVKLLGATATELPPRAEGGGASARLWTRLTAVSGTGGQQGGADRNPHHAERELGEAVGLMRTLKRALDPQDIMNPGKIFSL